MKSALLRFAALLLKPELVFVSLAIPFGILSAIMVPQMSVADENNHFLKAYSTASASLGGKNCEFPEAVRSKATAAPEKHFESDYSTKIDTSNTLPSGCGSASHYTPIMHLPQALGIYLAKLIYPSTGLMVLLGRLTNLFFFIVALYFIIKYVRIGKWVFTVIALLPLSIHSAASLSADVVNNVIVLAFVAFVFNLVTQTSKISKKHAAILLVLSGLLALTRVTNVVLLLPLLFLPVRLFPQNTLRKIPFNIYKWSLAALCGMIGVLTVLGWQKTYGSPTIGSAHETILSDNPFYFLTILSNTFINPFIDYGGAVISGIVGGFSSYQYNLPLFMTLLCFAVLFIALLHNNKEEGKNARTISLPFALSGPGAILLLTLAVTYAMYTTWAILPKILGPNAIYAAGVQGRYFTASLVLLIPFFIWLRQYIHFETKSPHSLGIIVFSASAFWLLFYTVETYRFIT